MKIKRGSTSVRRLIFVADSSSTVGAGLTGLAHNTSGLVAYYFAGDLSNEVQITLATATLGSYTSGGFIEVDATNMPGWYEVGIPDAALDGGNEVAIQFRGATNMVPVNIYIELDTVDYQTIAFGATTVTPLDAAGIRDAMGLAAANLDIQLSTIDTVVDNIEADTQDIQSRLPDALVDGRLVVLVEAMTANVLTASALASDAVAEIQTGLSTLDAEDIRLSVGLAAANLDTQLSATNTNIDSAELNILDAVGSITVDNAAIASAVRSELAAELGRIDVDVSSRLAASAYVGSKVVVPVSALPFQVVRRYDNKIILRRFAAFQWTLNDVGDLAGVTKLVFTIKEKPDSEVDSLSILQIVATIPANAGSDGITYVNKLSGTSVRTQGSIVVQSYTEDFVTKKRIIVTATDRATALIENYDNCRYDIKQITASDSDILEEGDLVIQDISTRLISS